MTGQRFTDDGTFVEEFLDRVRVRCPRCGEPAVVVTPLPYWSSVPRFVCAACTLTVEGRHTKWYGPDKGVATRRCGNCDTTVTKQLDGTVAAPTHADVRCSGCGSVGTATVAWSRNTRGGPLEPAFGMTLLLQAPCAGEVLWAYNERHLAFLEDYVRANLRERTGTMNGSLTSRLPAWLKSAKHRTAILHTIATLRAEFPASE